MNFPLKSLFLMNNDVWGTRCYPGCVNLNESKDHTLNNLASWKSGETYLMQKSRRGRVTIYRGMNIGAAFSHWFKVPYLSEKVVPPPVFLGAAGCGMGGD